jgi:hypothetical protein
MFNKNTILAYHLSCIVLVAVRFHIPNYLVAEELRYFSSLKDETFHISYQNDNQFSQWSKLNVILTKVIITKSLNNLGNKEKCQVHGMLLQDAMSVLQDKRIIIISPLKKCNSDDRRNRRPK